MVQGVVDWLDERIDLSGIRHFIAEKGVPIHTQEVWYYLGGMTMFLFAVQVFTGILLLLYYRPSSAEAYESVQFIVTQVRFGWLIRNVHSWSANLLIALAFAHFFSVFFLKSYRKPRELTWLTGILLLFLMLGFGFSGYLLPWNELSFFATKVGTGIAGAVPIIGPFTLRLLRGGDDVTGATLSRFYGLHVAILPAITTALVLAHLRPEHASAILAGLPADLQGEVAHRIALMERASPDVVAVIAENLMRKASTVLTPREMSAIGGVQPLVEIINRADATTEKAILEGLEARDVELAEEVRSRMFVFGDIVLLEDRALQLVLRQVETAGLSVALKGAGPEVREKILNNLSERASENLEEEIELLGPVRLSQVEDARSGIVQIIRRLEESGQIVIRRGDPGGRRSERGRAPRVTA